MLRNAATLPSGTMRPATLRTLRRATSSTVRRKGRVGLGDNLEGAAQEVEVVDVRRAHVELQGAEHRGGIQAKLLGAHAVDIGVDRGRTRAE